jgi:hypothetical protein
MNRPKMLKRTQERNFSPHHMLIRTAQRAYTLAEKQGPGWMYDALVTMTFSGLAIEALCNSVGAHVISDWKDFESLNPNAKLRIVTERLGLAYEKTAEPWSSIHRLVKFRNMVAHAKPEFVIQEEIIPQDEYDRRDFDVPESKLEKLLTIGNARRSLHAAEEVIKVVLSKISVEEGLGLLMDGWSGSASLHTES